MRITVTKMIALSGGVLMLVAAIPVCAQSFEQAVARLRKGFNTIDSLETTMTIHYYDSGTTKPHQLDRVEVKRASRACWYKARDLEFLVNDRCMLSIDHNDESIYYLASPVNTLAGMQPVPDSLLTKHYTVTESGQRGDVLHYRLANKQPAQPLTYVEIEIDLSMTHMTRLVYYYASGYRIEIVTHRFDRHPSFQRDTFSELRYISRHDGAIRPAANYKRYTCVIDDSRRDH